MHNDIIETITSREGNIRHRSEAELLSLLSREELLRTAESLEIFRHTSENLYHKVRASLFISTLYRFYLIDRPDVSKLGRIPFEGVKAALERRYDDAIEIYRISLMLQGLNEAILSALADAYYHLAFKYLADQVKLSISQSRGNHLLFAPQENEDVPFRLREEFTLKDPKTGLYPLGSDASPVRADPCHSGWSDIFFLGMDYPSGARVVNMSVDLAVHAKGPPVPPCQVFCRVIDKPVIRLVSMDLKCAKDVDDLRELFNFGNDHLGLLKAGVVASGVIPPSVEGKRIPLSRLLHQFLGRPGGFELVTWVKHLPKGSRLAVSTTLLATIITRLMRFSGQTRYLEGPLTEEERRMVASRAILGEWLGGSGGGWQDSGGIWPGIKIIQGVEAAHGDPEFGVSRGRLLPSHFVLAKEQLSEEIESRLTRSIVMVHGGMSQNVGPILEMVTEKYLLRAEREWKARLQGYEIFDEIIDAVKNGDMAGLGALTTRDWETTTKVIIPWSTNAFSEDLIAGVKERFGSDFWGFLMLGGMAGGGMAFLINPDIHDPFVEALGDLMLELKRFYNHALPFAMDPVVFDFEINYDGIAAQLLRGRDALLPDQYYDEGLQNAEASGDTTWIDEHENELRCLEKSAAGNPGAAKAMETSWDEKEADRIKRENGFDAAAHEKLKSLLKAGRIGTSKNRLPLNTRIEDVRPGEVQIAFSEADVENADAFRKAGLEALEQGRVAVVTYSGGLGSRWTEGAAVVKPINPFVMMAGKHRSFTEIHLAKSRRAAAEFGAPVQHVFTTSFLTHAAFERYLSQSDHFGYEGPIHLSRAHAIGHRVYPMERDLRFIWEELPQQMLDEQQQKILEDYHEAVIQWTREAGEGDDYRENLPIQRFNPPGHWHEIPNMFKNGVLARLLEENPELRYLLVHNTDTLGAGLDPLLLGMHMASKKVLTFEVTPRRFEDKGGGLALVDGKPQLMEALALPREEDEFKLSFYNTLTNWIDLEGLLGLFGLERKELLEAEKSKSAAKRVTEAVRRVEERMPTYVTIKEVKLIWGAGQEDIFPVAQFEKLWGDMSRLYDASVHYLGVNRQRGQQLKDPAQLDRWVRDGSCAAVEAVADFEGGK
ncbi:MAG: UTP--glucose-1-phosphate uridylyltransferase [Planctomycetota bacterium]|jgi:hypothetical protein